MATSVRLDAQTDQRLTRLAEQTGRSKAFYLRELVARGLDEMEEYYLAAEVLERIRKREEGTHAAGDVRRELGLAD